MTRPITKDLPLCAGNFSALHWKVFRAALLVTLLVGCTQPQARRAHRAGEVATATGLIGMLVAGTTASLLPAHEDAILTAGLVFVPVALGGALVYIATDQKAMERDHG